MNQLLCGYIGDRQAALMDYLYGEMTPEDRAAFDMHLSSCARCRTELTAFNGVRRQLARWSPPEFAPIMSRTIDGESTAPRRSWHDIPAWARVAAAMLLVGVAAGIANLDVHYDAQGGLNVHTGWLRAASPSAATSTNGRNDLNQSNVASAAGQPNVSALTAIANRPGPAPWRADLAELERQLRSEMHASQNAGGPVGVRASPANEAELMRRVKVLLDESERRQQRELALRVTALMQEVNAQRQADLRRIDQNLGMIQDRTGVEVLKNRQMIDYYMQRVSQRP